MNEEENKGNARNDFVEKLEIYAILIKFATQIREYPLCRYKVARNSYHLNSQTPQKYFSMCKPKTK